MFSDFRDRFPEIYLDIRLQSSGAQIEALVQGEIDAGFAISPLPRSGLFLDTLYRTGFVLQAPQSLCEPRSREMPSERVSGSVFHCPCEQRDSRI